MIELNLLKISLISCLLMGVCSDGFSQELNYIEEETSVYSEILKEEVSIDMYFPADEMEELVVIYVLDGNWNYDLVKGTVAHWVRWKLAPNMAVVSINNTKSRTRDYTPTIDEKSYPGSGGGVSFLKFVAEELQPAVEEKFKKPSYDLLFGHSFGGLFALYTLKEQPTLFDGYIAASPSLWWKDQYMYGAYNFEGLKNKPFVYSTAGTNDRGNTKANQDFVTWLSKEGYEEQLELHSDILTGEDHFSNVPISLHNGLKKLFPKEKWEELVLASYEGAQLESLKEKVDELKQSYGIRFSFPADVLLKKSLDLHKNKRTDQAIELLTWTQNQVPDNYQPSYYLGYLFNSKKDTTNAINYYEEALRIGGMPGRMKIVIEREILSLGDLPILVKELSTANVETSFAIHPDEEIAFVSRHDGKWGSNENPPVKIYQYQKTAGEWKYDGISIFSDENSKDSDSNIFISYDGKEAFFVSNRTYDGKNDSNSDIWKSTWSKSGWSDPKPVMEVNSPGYEMSPVTDLAGNLYFSSIREGGKGMGDFYQAKRNADGSYKKPMILTGEINGSSGEWNLLVSPEADWIVFESSGREEGLSPYGDLYLSYREKDGWSKPIHLKEMNSTGSDLNVRYLVNSDELYFVSSKKLESTKTDIYKIDRSILDKYY